MRGDLMSDIGSDTSGAARPRVERDVFGTVALGAAAVSLLGFVVLVVGHAVDPSDFNNGKHPSPANNVAFLAYVLGLLIALLLGGAAWFYGRRSGRTGPRSSAAFATYYGVVFLVVGIVAAALGG
jgi:hypothetical protein